MSEGDSFYNLLTLLERGKLSPFPSAPKKVLKMALVDLVAAQLATINLKGRDSLSCRRDLTNQGFMR